MLVDDAVAWKAESLRLQLVSCLTDFALGSYWGEIFSLDAGGATGS